MPNQETEIEEKEKKGLSLRPSVAGVVGLVLCIILIPILLINCTLIIKSYLHEDRVPTAAGMFPMIVLTDSMVPAINSGDLIVCRTAAPESVKVGDVICYYSRPTVNLETVTHRVTEITTTDEGNLAWVTKGDANNAADAKKVEAGQLVGVYMFRVPGAGRIAMFMQTPQGILAFVVLPLILLVIYDIFRRRQYELQRQREAAEMQLKLDILRSRNQVEDQLKRNGDTDSST